MQTLYINISDIHGGAALGGYRLHQALLSRNVDSRMLVGDKRTRSDRIDQLPITLTDKVLKPIVKGMGLNYINAISSFQAIDDHPSFQNADIVTFHCLHNDFFNYLAFPKLTRQKPSIFRLSDMWGFTGHCAYSFSCEKWKTGCGNCPFPDTYPAIRRDSTRLEWKLKEWVYNRSHLDIVVPSQWLYDQVQNSLLGRFHTHLIPNGIDITQYQPLDQNMARQALGLPEHKFILMFTAQDLNDFRKGGDLLVKALNQLPRSLQSDVVLLCLGSGGEAMAECFSFPTFTFGYIESSRLKALAYSASDLFLFPTRADTFGLVLIESMACATPVVSFAVGGVPEIITHGETGLLASAEDFQGMSSHIEDLLGQPDLLRHMGLAGRQTVEQNYSIQQQCDRYMDLYSGILARHGHQR